MSFAAELEAQAQEVLRRVGDAVVSIGRTGSGLVVSDGFVLTNAHNVRADEVRVTFPGGAGATGDVTGIDVDGDIAVVAVPTDGIVAPEWSPSPAATGRVVFALARSRPGDLRLTTGTVSATGQSFRGPGGRLVTDGIEHTAPLARGSSGGPVVDVAGRVLGLNTNRLGEGFYLAITADAALRERVEGLIEGRSPERRRLGIGVAPSSVARRLRASVGLPPRDGVLVRAVGDDSPADRAGVRVGDLVVAAGGRALRDIDDLQDVLDAADHDAPLPLDVLRGSEALSITVTFEPLREEGSV
jgi:serine protease Do